MATIFMPSLAARTASPQDALAVALLVVLLALGEHGVDQARELVGRGGDGLGFIHA